MGSPEIPRSSCLDEVISFKPRCFFFFFSYYSVICLLLPGPAALFMLELCSSSPHPSHDFTVKKKREIKLFFLGGGAVCVCIDDCLNSDILSSHLQKELSLPRRGSL